MRWDFYSNENLHARNFSRSKSGSCLTYNVEFKLSVGSSTKIIKHNQLLKRIDKNLPLIPELKNKVI